jgi:hypothetical protein
MLTRVAGELTGRVCVGRTVTVVLVFEVTVLAQLVEEVVQVVDHPAMTHEAPEQVYPAPNMEVQYALGFCTPPQPPITGAVGLAKTQETPLQVYPGPYWEVQKALGN